MGAHRRTTEEDVDGWVEMVRMGRSVKQISERTGVGRCTIAKYLDARGVEREHRPVFPVLTPEQIAAVRRGQLGEVSRRDIAIVLGVSYSSVVKAATDHGVTSGRGGSRKVRQVNGAWNARHAA